MYVVLKWAYGLEALGESHKALGNKHKEGLEALGKGMGEKHKVSESDAVPAYLIWKLHNYI